MNVHSEEELEEARSHHFFSSKNTLLMVDLKYSGVGVDKIVFNPFDKVLPLRIMNPGNHCSFFVNVFVNYITK